VFLSSLASVVEADTAVDIQVAAQVFIIIWLLAFVWEGVSRPFVRPSRSPTVAIFLARLSYRDLRLTAVALVGTATLGSGSTLRQRALDIQVALPA
jgi:hypothetical protein